MKRQRKCDERRDALKMPTACKLQPTLLSHLSETRGIDPSLNRVLPRIKKSEFFERTTGSVISSKANEE